MRGFSDDEAEQIRESLISAGRDRFGHFGIKKTTIKELTDSADIAKGSFYRFFDSKEDLYLEVVQREREELAGPFIEAVRATEDTEAAVKTMLQITVEIIEENPIIRRIWIEDLEKLLQKASDDKLGETVGQGLDIFIPLLEEMQADGRLRQYDPELVAYIFRVFVIGLIESKEHFGESYPAVRDATIEIVASGLVEKADYQNPAK